jgi:hypothetical protein
MVLQKAYYTLEHLDDLLRPLLFSLRAAMHVKRFCWLGYVQRILLVTAQIGQATGTEEL